MLALFASTREAERALAGWPEPQWQAFVQMQYQAQQRHCLQQYPRSRCDVVMQGQGDAAHAVGRLWVNADAHALHVLDITLLPIACGHGLGTQLMGELQRQAAAKGLAVSLSVDVNNLPARRLYERLGYQAAGPVQGFHQPMQWRQPEAAILHPEECGS